MAEYSEENKLKQTAAADELKEALDKNDNDRIRIAAVNYWALEVDTLPPDPLRPQDDEIRSQMQPVGNAVREALGSGEAKIEERRAALYAVESELRADSSDFLIDSQNVTESINRALESPALRKMVRRENSQAQRWVLTPPATVTEAHANDLKTAMSNLGSPINIQDRQQPGMGEKIHKSLTTGQSPGFNAKELGAAARSDSDDDAEEPSEEETSGAGSKGKGKGKGKGKRSAGTHANSGGGSSQQSSNKSSNRGQGGQEKQPTRKLPARAAAGATSGRLPADDNSDGDGLVTGKGKAPLARGSGSDRPSKNPKLDRALQKLSGHNNPPHSDAAAKDPTDENAFGGRNLRGGAQRYRANLEAAQRRRDERTAERKPDPLQHDPASSQSDPWDEPDSNRSDVAEPRRENTLDPRVRDDGRGL